MQFNQVFFSELQVDADGIAGAELTEEMGFIMAEELAKRLQGIPGRFWGGRFK